MQLHKILSGIAFLSGLLGVGGIAGAITWGTGYITSGVLILISICSGVWAAYETGEFKKPHRSNRSREANKK